MTKYFLYITANKAVDFFKDAIIKLDKINIYNKKTEVEDICPDDIKEYKNSENYKEKMEQVEKDLVIWREEHKNYYRMQPSLPSSEKYSLYFKGIDIETLTLEEAIQGYKAAQKALKEIEKSDLDKYCTDLKPMLNIEHKEEYNEEVERLKDLYEVPTDEEIKASLKPKKFYKYRLSLDRKPVENESFFTSYVEQFITNVDFDINND